MTHKHLDEAAAKPGATVADAIGAAAKELIDLADGYGLVITIVERPLKPFAMGHNEYFIVVRPRRGTR